MATKNDRIVPARAVHPGEILREELLQRGIKQKAFAEQIGMQPSHLNAFIKGKRNLNHELALLLEKYLAIPYKTWMNLHNSYMYERNAIESQQDEEQKAMEYEHELANMVNVKYLYKRLGILQYSCAEKVRRLKELFPFDLLSSDKLGLQVAGMYKHSEKVHADNKNMLTWLILNWLQTSQAVVDNEYVSGNAIKAAQEIARMANDHQMNVEGIKKCLNYYGIAYLVVPKIEKAPIDAYSTMANGHPCITVTYRYNDMDKLAFDILHELCHIDRHLSDDHKAFIAIEGSEYSNDPREKEANLFARQMLIPDSAWKKIIGAGCKKLSPLFVVKTIATEAEKLGISASIAIARYKHDTGWYKTSAYRSPKIV